MSNGFPGRGRRLGAALDDNELTDRQADEGISHENTEFLREQSNRGNTYGLRHTHDAEVRRAAAQRGNHEEPGYYGDAFQLSPERDDPEFARRFHRGANLTPDRDHRGEVYASIGHALAYAFGEASRSNGVTGPNTARNRVTDNSRFDIADYGGAQGNYDEYRDSRGRRTAKKFGLQHISPERIQEQVQLPQTDEMDGLQARTKDLRTQDVQRVHRDLETTTVNAFADSINHAVDHLRVRHEHAQHTPGERRQLSALAAEDRMNPRPHGPTRVQEKRTEISRRLRNQRNS